MLALQVSCSREKIGSQATDLTGEWQWLQSDGGIANLIHDTPASTGKKVTLRLTADWKYYYYTNDVLTEQGTYALETRTCIHDHGEKTLINFSGSPDQMVETMDGSTLQLSDEAYDGITSLYRKTAASTH